MLSLGRSRGGILLPTRTSIGVKKIIHALVLTTINSIGNEMHYTEDVLKKSLLLIVLVCNGAALSFGQHNPQPKGDIEGLLLKLKSDDIQERERAYQKLKADSATVRSKKGHAALLDLLDRENEALHYQSQPTNSAYPDEAKTEYIYELGDTVYEAADWTDPNEMCLLVKNGLVPPSHSASEAANRERVALPCLWKLSESERVWDRMGASVLLIKLWAKAGDVLDAATSQEVRRILERALHDQHEFTRATTIEYLQKYGREDMIPALRAVAESDPAIDKESQQFYLREYAAKAAAEIQRRTGKH